ncbi:MAG: hypothetical protein V1871_01990 [Planctomycetota bacterium]
MITYPFHCNKGSTLVWVMLAMVLMLGSITVGTALLQNTVNLLESHMEYYGQTTGIAKAGLFDALAWFRRQTAQPVATFNPQLNLAAIPPVNDTDDPAIGIVREIEMEQSSGIYGRYEVISSTVLDISAQRGLIGTGTMWYIESTGYIYLKSDPTKAYNVSPNRVIGSMRVATEIRRVSLVLPAEAALCDGNPSQTVIGNDVKIIGGSHYGIVYPAGAGTPNINPNATVTGTPTAKSQLSPYYDSCEQVFGVSESTLKSIADYYVTSVDDLPNPIPDYKIVFFEGNATFNSSTPLNGTGIFYITGNMTIAANSSSSYNGVIYCNGQYHQHGPSMISGSVITKGQVNMESTGDIAEIDYDSSILQQIRTYTGQYRFAKGIYIVQ